MIGRASSAATTAGAHHDHGSCVAEVVAAAERRALEGGSRFTPLRRHVLELICASHKPIGAYELLDLLERSRRGRAGPPTIYRTLDFLMDRGLVHRIASLNAFVACFGPDLPHNACLFICERCRTVDESEAREVREAIDRKASAIGFAVRARTVEVSGLCRTCAAAA